MSTVKAKIVKIGNSKGIRIPKTILEQCNIKDEVELEAKGDSLVIRSPHSTRKGWELAFKKMRENKDDLMVIKEELPTEWDEQEWEW